MRLQTPENSGCDILDSWSGRSPSGGSTNLAEVLLYTDVDDNSHLIRFGGLVIEVKEAPTVRNNQAPPFQRTACFSGTGKFSQSTIDRLRSIPYETITLV